MEQREFDQIESVIQAKEAELEVMKQKLESPDVVSDAKKLIEISQQAASIEKDIETLYARWQYLEDKAQK